MSKDERITVRIPHELKVRIETTANALNVSTNDMIKFILANYFNK